MFSTMWGIFAKGPGEQIRVAAKSGTPAMTPLHPEVPASVPGSPVLAGTAPSADVTVSTVPASSSALDTKPDARQSRGGGQTTTPPDNGQKQKPDR